MKSVRVISIMMSLSLGQVFVLNSAEQMQAQRDAAVLIPWEPNRSALLATSKIEPLSTAPYIMNVHNFITDAEADFVKETARPLLKRSVVVGDKNASIASENRTSSSAFLDGVQSDIITGIRQRAANFLKTDLANIEYLQVVYYRDGQKYEPHFDYFDRNLASAKEVIGAQGQRIATLLVYLNDVKPGVGGETLFPKVNGGLKVRPEKNMAVFWYNVLPSGKEDDRTLHGGLPIHEGEKWAINIWIRDPRLINPR